MYNKDSELIPIIIFVLLFINNYFYIIFVIMYCDIYQYTITFFHYIHSVLQHSYQTISATLKSNNNKSSRIRNTKRNEETVPAVKLLPNTSRF